MGLWPKLVCWPLIAAQNAGTGSTAYSLGGLGKYPATLISTVSWSTSGLIGNSVACGVSTTLVLPTGNSSRSLFSVWKNASAAQFIPISTTSPDLNRFLLRSNSNSPMDACADCYNGTTYDLFGDVVVPSGFNTSALSYNSSTNGLIFKANTLSASTATVPKSFASSPVVMGGYSGVGYMVGTVSFAAAMTVALSSDDMDTLRSLYKATLGASLSLP